MTETAYCRTCGAGVRETAEICPECGTRQFDPDPGADHSVSQQTYFWLGVCSGVAALLVLPIVFGPLAILCGIQVARHYSAARGFVVVAWGVLTLVVGWLLGILLMVLL